MSIKFETKMAKLGVNEEEVKSIIANCECGEVNGAYFIDLTKEKKEFIMEVVGNYLDDDSEEFEGWTDIKRISTFCKTFDISEDEIPDYYRLGFNEGGCDIAYTLESNKDVILVLTDDERYHNSFIQYSPSQQTEEKTEENNEVENMEFTNEQERAGAEYTFCYDCNYNRGDAECGNCTYYDDESEENWVTFKVVSKEDERLYLAGEVDISSIDDEYGGDWSYEQNNGLFDSHLPSYWKVGSENLSYEFSMFLNNVDWDLLRQNLFDFKDENRLIDCVDYILHINGGASVEIEIIKYSDFEDTYWATLMFRYNGEFIVFDENIIRDLAESLSFDGEYRITSASSIDLQLPRGFSDYADTYDVKEAEEVISEMTETVREHFARQLSRDAGIYTDYGENIEQLVEKDIASDKEQMFLFNSAVSRNCVKDWMIENAYLEE